MQADTSGSISRATHLATNVSGADLPQHVSNLKLESNWPQHLHSLHQQAAAQSTNAEAVQPKKAGTNTVTASSKQSRGGRGAPLGRSGKGRGRGRHRVTID